MDLSHRHPQPFSIDRAYDRGSGGSRYGNYIRDAVARDSGAWDMGEPDGRHEFASLAWRTGSGPVMSPGYIRYDPMVSGASVYRSPWDGTLVASVALRTPRPRGLAGMAGWRGWPTEWHDGSHVPVAPYERDVTRPRSAGWQGFALTTVELLFPLHEVELPALPPAPDAPDVPEAAEAAAQALVAALNGVVAKVIEAL